MKTQLAALLLAALLAAPCAAGGYSSEELKKMFQQSVATDDMRLRIRLRTKIAESSPESAYGLTSRAFLLTMSGRANPASVAQLYTKALELDPTIGVAHYNRAGYYQKLGEKQKALEGYKTAIAVGYKKADAYVGLADAYRDLGQNEAALENLGKALALDPGHAFAHNNRGAIYLHTKEYDKAIADFNAALNTSTFAMAYMNRGDAYAGKKDFQKALADYKTAEGMIPDGPDVYARRGRVYLKMGEDAKAITDAETALEMDPRDPTALDVLATAAWRSGDQVRAEDAFKRYAAASPAEAYPYVNLAIIYDNQKRADLAVEALAKAVKLAPQRADLKEKLAKMQAGSGDVKSSESNLTDLISGNGKEPRLYYFRARTRFEAEDYKGAEADLKEMLKSAPDSPDAMITLSLVFLRTGRRSEGLELASSVLDTEPARRKSLAAIAAGGDPRYAAHKNYRAALKEMLKLYDAGSSGETAPAKQAARAPAPAAGGGILTQDDCYCVYYTGQTPPYFLAKVNSAPPGCEKIKFKPDPTKPGVSGLRNCDEFQKDE